MSIAVITAAVVGWIAARALTAQSSANSNLGKLGAKVKLLLERQQQGELRPQEKRRLLEQLIVLGRPRQARELVEQFMAEQPKALIWPLMISEFNRREGDLDGALEEINRLLALHPHNHEVLRMKAVLELDKGRGSSLASMLRSTFDRQPRGERLTTGLLLADVKRQIGQSNKAAALYKALAGESPKDARPLIALALLKQEQGRYEEAQTILIRARQRRTKPGEADRMIDSLAAQWRLLSARKFIDKKTPQASDSAATEPTKTPRSHRP